MIWNVLIWLNIVIGFVKCDFEFKFVWSLCVGEIIFLFLLNKGYLKCIWVCIDVLYYFLLLFEEFLKIKKWIKF